MGCNCVGMLSEVLEVFENIWGDIIVVLFNEVLLLGIKLWCLLRLFIFDVEEDDGDFFVLLMIFYLIVKLRFLFNWINFSNKW